MATLMAGVRQALGAGSTEMPGPARASRCPWGSSAILRPMLWLWPPLCCSSCEAAVLRSD